MTFQQGDIIEFDFNPSKGHEPAGRRPALIVSSDYFNMSTSMTLVCPITTTDNGFPLHFPLPNNLKTNGFVIVEQVRAFDLEARNPKCIEHLSDSSMQDALRQCLQSFF